MYIKPFTGGVMSTFKNFQPTDAPSIVIPCRKIPICILICSLAITLYRFSLNGIFGRGGCPIKPICNKNLHMYQISLWYLSFTQVIEWTDGRTDNYPELSHHPDRFDIYDAVSILISFRSYKQLGTRWTKLARV